MSALKTLLTLLLPGILVVVPASIGLAVAADSAVLRTAAQGGYPAVALGLALFLAWRFQRSRVFAGALALVIAYGLLGAWPAEYPDTAADLAQGLLALLLGGLALDADRRVGAPQGLVQVAVVLWAGAGAVALLAVAPERVEWWLTASIVDPSRTAWIGVEPLVLGTVGLGLGAVLMMAVLRHGMTEAGLGWALVAGVGAFTFPPAAPGRGVLVLAAGLALVLTVIESSYGMAFRDELTRLPGRRALDEALRSLRPPYSVAVIDIDRFKQVNDRYGHDVGDQVLRMVAAELDRVGGGGRAFRSGGEEFTLVFPGRTRDEALPHVQAARAAVAADPFTVRRWLRAAGRGGASKRGRGAGSSKKIRITISAGIASPGEADAVEAVVGAADRAMYKAKKSGRNRVASA